MDGLYKERWQELCKQVAEEKDSLRFEQLVQQLLEALRQKEERLKKAKGTAAG